MFYKVREEGFNEFRQCYHSVWREDYKIADKLSWTDSIKLLSTEMLTYDTMQVENTGGQLYELIWDGNMVKKKYQELLEDTFSDIVW